MDHTIAPGMPAKKPAQTAFGKRMVALRQARGLSPDRTRQGGGDYPTGDFLLRNGSGVSHRLGPHPSGSCTPGDRRMNCSA